MKRVRFEDPPLSFEPKTLLIEKLGKARYKIVADGSELGVLLVRDDYWLLTPNDMLITEDDKEFLIIAARELD